MKRAGCGEPSLALWDAFLRKTGGGGGDRVIIEVEGRRVFRCVRFTKIEATLGPRTLPAHNVGIELGCPNALLSN